MSGVTIMVEATVPTSVLSDGRNRRSADSKRSILAACRELMIGGVWRPSMAETCELARRSLRTGFQHFVTVEALHREALQDGVVRESIIRRAVGEEVRFLTADACDRIVRCVVLGMPR